MAKRKLFSEMGPGDKQLLNEPEDENQAADPNADPNAEVTPLGDKGEGDGDSVAVYGSDQESGEGDSLDTADSLDDEGEDLSSDIGFDDAEGESSMGEDPEQLVTNLASALAAIMKFGNSDDVMTDDEAMQEAVNLILGEDASTVRQTMLNHTSRRAGAWEASDFKDLAEDLVSAQGDFYTPKGLEEKLSQDALYYTITSQSKDSGVRVMEVTKMIEPAQRQRAVSEARSENQLWKDRLSDMMDAQGAQGGGGGFAEDLSRVHSVRNAREVLEVAEQFEGIANSYLFFAEDVASSLNISEDTLAEADAKSIASKTRKTHSVGNTDWASMADASIKSVLTASGLGKKAPGRRGDKTNSEKMSKIHDLARQATNTQVANMWKAAKTMKESLELVDDVINLELNNEVDAIMALDESMDDTMRQDITMVFENALVSKVKDVVPAILYRLEEAKQAEIEKIQDTFLRRIDEFLDYTVDNFMEENQVAIDQGIAHEIQESFLKGMHSLFESHYIEVPEGKENLLDREAARADAAEELVEKAKKTALGFKKKALKMFRENTAYRLSKGLSSNETAKLHKLLEGVEFDSEDEFITKAKVIRENNFPTNSERTVNINRDKDEEFATLVEQNEPTSSTDGSKMGKYANIIKKMS